MDVARKVVILGRVAGLDLTLESIEVENIVPVPLRPETLIVEPKDDPAAQVAAFMNKLPDFDGYFEKLNQEAIKGGQVLRYVGRVDPKGKSSVTLAR